MAMAVAPVPATALRLFLIPVPLPCMILVTLHDAVLLSWADDSESCSETKALCLTPLLPAVPRPESPVCLLQGSTTAEEHALSIGRLDLACSHSPHFDVPFARLHCRHHGLLWGRFNTRCNLAVDFQRWDWLIRCAALRAVPWVPVALQQKKTADGPSTLHTSCFTLAEDATVCCSCAAEPCRHFVHSPHCTFIHDIVQVLSPLQRRDVNFTTARLIHTNLRLARPCFGRLQRQQLGLSLSTTGQIDAMLLDATGQLSFEGHESIKRQRATLRNAERIVQWNPAIRCRSRTSCHREVSLHRQRSKDPRSALALEGVNDVERSDRFALGVLGVGDGTG
jgi:hypothetical protein